ncbi:MAG: phage/plasmid primase, P4 family [Christensenella sp.]
MNICNEIKQRINCVEYAQRVGIQIKHSGDRCISPLRTNAKNKNSFVMYNDFWYDFGSSMGGDVIDLCAEYAHDGDRRMAISELSALTGVTDTQSIGNWRKHTQNNCSLIQKWHDNLRISDRDYLHSRKITDETIKRLKIGYTGPGIKYHSEKHNSDITGFAQHRLAIPYYKNGYVANWVARATEDNQAPKYLKPEINQYYDSSAIWGLHTIDRKGDTIVVAEGAFDALSFDQEDYPVIATMGGFFSHEQISTVRDICRKFNSVFLCFDNDVSGNKFTLKLSQCLFSNRIKFVVGQLPSKYKDVSDYYTDGGNLDELVTNAVDGLIALATMLTDESDFKKFILQTSRYVDKPTLSKLFAAVADNFSAAWLAEVRKLAFAAPSEDTVARSVECKHQLRYLANVGFYEYQRGAWRFKADEQLQVYISEELGFYRTGARLSSIIKLIKSDTITTETFDKKPLFNFINGTLELATGLFREHRPDDLLSIQANYPYSPTASYKNWAKFIKQICNYNPKRMSLLQELSGYILFPTCELERIFVLMGDGGNGKSKFLEMLTAVFGSENRSSVTIAGLCADFQRINISNSLFNVSTEIKANLAGSEEYLKQIASGETISACYKGKNFIDFNPRCKMIFATNGQVKSKDTSDGLARRMCIIDFECKFVENPARPNEHMIDVHITDKLTSEIPGIFNWAYEGYKLLRSALNFTVTDDEERLKGEFKEASNPLITFMREFIEDCTDDRISYSELYEEYKSWCIRTGHQTGTQTYLTRGFKKIMPDNFKTANTYYMGNRFKGFLIEKGDS